MLENIYIYIKITLNDINIFKALLD